MDESLPQSRPVLVVAFSPRHHFIETSSELETSAIAVLVEFHLLRQRRWCSRTDYPLGNPYAPFVGPALCCLRLSLDRTTSRSVKMLCELQLLADNVIRPPATSPLLLALPGLWISAIFADHFLSRQLSLNCRELPPIAHGTTIECG